MSNGDAAQGADPVDPQPEKTPEPDQVVRVPLDPATRRAVQEATRALRLGGSIPWQARLGEHAVRQLWATHGPNAALASNFTTSWSQNFALAGYAPVAASITRAAGLSNVAERVLGNSDLGAQVLRAALPGFDVSAAVRATLPSLNFGTTLASVLRGVDLAALSERLFSWRPENWPEGADTDLLVRIANEDGLPVAWVPRAEVLEEVLAEADRDARVGVLVAHRLEVVNDCREALDEVTHEVFAGTRPLADAALAAFAAGHEEAAQALAVAVTETVVTRTYGRKYAEVARLVVADLELVAVGDLRFRVSLAPIARFYTSWWSNTGTAPPTALARHVTVHHADASHYTTENALVAVMLMSSVLRAHQEHQEREDADAAEASA